MLQGSKQSCNCIIGYACINETLASLKPAVSVNRSMIKKTFQSRGLQYAGQLALQNLHDVEKIVHWNYEHKIFLYRMSSDMFPWASEYHISDLPQAKIIIKQLGHIGKLACDYNQRLTFHPGQFNVLASPNNRVVENTIKELEFHGQVMDYMNLPRSTYAKINIHLGGSYGNKRDSMERFCKNFDKLSLAVRDRLTIENDDKVAMYTIQDLHQGVYERIGVPIVFDYLHYQCNPGDLSERDAFLLAFHTWSGEVEPVFHVSESRQKHDLKAPKRAHADYITECVDTYGKKISLMLEAKAKELAVQKYKTLCCKDF